MNFSRRSSLSLARPLAGWLAGCGRRERERRANEASRGQVVESNVPPSALLFLSSLTNKEVASDEEEMSMSMRRNEKKKKEPFPIDQLCSKLRRVSSWSHRSKPPLASN